MQLKLDEKNLEDYLTNYKIDPELARALRQVVGVYTSIQIDPDRMNEDYKLFLFEQITRRDDIEGEYS